MLRSTGGATTLSLVLICLCALIVNPCLDAQETSNLVKGENEWKQARNSSGYPSLKPDFQIELIRRLSDHKAFNENMRIMEEFWTKPIDVRHEKETFRDWLVHALTTRSTSFFYCDTLNHVYNDFDDLMKSSSINGIDRDVCLDQLVNLTERAKLVKREKFLTKDLNLLQILDTYGRPPPGMLNGDFFWPGIYDECLKLSIKLPDGRNQPTRYCIASLALKKKPSNFAKPHSDVVSFKAGICLPKTCDSFDDRSKYQLITELVEFNLKASDKDQLELTYLYCVPEEDSPLRNWKNEPKTVIAMIIISTWILFVIFATIKYENLRDIDKQPNAERQSSFSLNSGLSPSKIPSTDKRHKTKYELLGSLSIIRSIENLLGITHRKPDINQKEDAQAKKEERVIDFGSLEGIKVLLMLYSIIGHAYMCLTMLTANSQVYGHSYAFNVRVMNMAPAFIVNAFFAMTGIVTTYLIFKQDNPISFMTNPLKWAALIIYRYIRIMPMYVVVTLFYKYIVKFTGSGPHWDYGTSPWSPRRHCEQESWLWTLLFGANFKPVLEHCTVPAWYLANDFQFFVVTPIFLAALYKKPEFGKLLLKICIVAGYMASSLTIFQSEIDDFRALSSFRPHGFRVYLTYLSHNYTHPHYRIPAYLSGLLFGHVLYTYEQDKTRYNEKKRFFETNGEDSSKLAEPCWSAGFKSHGTWLCLLMISICFWIPYVGGEVPLSISVAKPAIALMMPLYHIVFALASGSYILLAATGHGNKFLNFVLSASVWKPFARLNLCALLVNVEVVSYIIRTTREQMHLNIYTHISLNLFCIVAVYVVSTMAYLFFEAPMKSLTNSLVSYAVSRVSKKQKTH